MSTTALFSEILVGGVLALTWIVLGLLGIFEKSSVDELLGKNPIAAGAIFLAYSYALGVVLDRFWDSLTKPIDRKVRSSLNLTDENIKTLRKSVFANKDKAPEYIEYIRSRMRISRATLCNSIPLSITAVFFYYRVAKTPNLLSAGAVILCGALGAILSYKAFKKLLLTYYKQLMIMGSETEQAAAGNVR